MEKINKKVTKKCNICYQAGIAEGKKQIDSLSHKAIWEEGFREGKRQEQDIKADHLAGHYSAGIEEGKVQEQKRIPREASPDTHSLQIIDNWLKSYPEDIFPKITPSLLKKASDFFMTNFGFPLDRLSAHIIRDALIKIKGEIENGKRKL